MQKLRFLKPEGNVFLMFGFECCGGLEWVWSGVGGFGGFDRVCAWTWMGLTMEVGLFSCQRGGQFRL